MVFTYKATSLPYFGLISVFFLNDTMHFSCYIYVPTSSNSILCDVASRNLIADIIYHNSVFSSDNFIGCTTTVEFCATSNTGLPLTVHLLGIIVKYLVPMPSL